MTRPNRMSAALAACSGASSKRKGSSFFSSRCAPRDTSPKVKVLAKHAGQGVTSIHWWQPGQRIGSAV
jgi:surface antigen